MPIEEKDAKNKVAGLLKKIPRLVEINLPKILRGRGEKRIKGDGSFVSASDIFLQNLLSQEVTRVLEDVEVVSEEDEHRVASNKSVVVVIDPLDGTENFVSGLPIWGVSVSVFMKGVHVGSIIGCPELKMWLKSGDNILKRESRIKGLSSSMSMDDLLKVERDYEFRITGCCVFNMICVIQGCFRSFENVKGASAWDILGGINLATEHGLQVTVEGNVYAGEYLQPTKSYCFRVQRG